MQNDWIKCIRQEINDFKWLPSKNARICSDHFCNKDYKGYDGERKVMLKKAFPCFQFKKIRTYDSDQKSFALTLHLYGHKAYDYLWTNGFHLPHTRTLRNNIPKLKKFTIVTFDLGDKKSPSNFPPELFRKLLVLLVLMENNLVEGLQNLRVLAAYDLAVMEDLVKDFASALDDHSAPGIRNKSTAGEVRKRRRYKKRRPTDLTMAPNNYSDTDSSQLDGANMQDSTNSHHLPKNWQSWSKQQSDSDDMNNNMFSGYLGARPKCSLSRYPAISAPVLVESDSVTDCLSPIRLPRRRRHLKKLPIVIDNDPILDPNNYRHQLENLPSSIRPLSNSQQGETSMPFISTTKFRTQSRDVTVGCSRGMMCRKRKRSVRESGTSMVYERCEGEKRFNRACSSCSNSSDDDDEDSIDDGREGDDEQSDFCSDSDSKHHQQQLKQQHFQQQQQQTTAHDSMDSTDATTDDHQRQHHRHQQQQAMPTQLTQLSIKQQYPTHRYYIPDSYPHDFSINNINNKDNNNNNNNNSNNINNNNDMDTDLTTTTTTTTKMAAATTNTISTIYADARRQLNKFNRRNVN
ncbi:hypothetical protein HELRODRAFT_176953 [Helobdella robusta]|uniref:THAP-type domain-containing protein n=1 Tax=Helobdella robusta TaxID=6412 RepID=T1FB24_HELRO|nr:hypothetical protein HELRODRAFT_176953 [Helobdella robusta]ESN98477.1 hypothetical protein HELRODRAFT_176953 [Helobdella robusta]